MQDGNQSQSQLGENYVSMEKRKSRAQEHKLLESKWMTSESSQVNYSSSLKSTDQKYKYTIPMQGNTQGGSKDKINFVTEIPKNLNVIKGNSQNAVPTQIMQQNFRKHSKSVLKIVPSHR